MHLKLIIAPLEPSTASPPNLFPGLFWVPQMEKHIYFGEEGTKRNLHLGKERHVSAELSSVW